MPIETFKSVREVSSEDSVHVAANLLQQLPGKRWKTKSVGEKTAYIILELDGPKQITGIDIGNEHSAFVEVLVGKTGCTREHFKEILITCSFMTPIESKNSSNANRVRCFGQEALVESTRSEKWQMVKVICTQPFNKHVQYGISFIKVHVTESIPKKDQQLECLVPEKFRSGNVPSKANEREKGSFGLGKFTLREDSPDSESDSTGLFSRWKMSRNKECTAAASIREASSNFSASRRLSENHTKLKEITQFRSGVNNEKSIDTAKPKVVDRNREELLFGNDSDQPHYKRLEAKIEVDKERLRRDMEKHSKHEKTHKISINKQVSSLKKDDKSKTSNLGEKDKMLTSIKPTTPEIPKKRLSSPTNRPAKKHKLDSIKYRPFNQLLKGVVLVISGIQNPDRSDLRNKALAMGAKYKQDWENGCTHLICAFKNTPKYKQVHGNGKIVTRSWIEQCYTKKKYLPWRRFALDSMELTKSESDEELLDESLKSLPADDIVQSSTSYRREDSQKYKKDNTLAMYDLGGEEEILLNVSISSGSDTEDDIEKATAKMKSKVSTDCNKENLSKAKISPKDIFDASTEEEEFLKEKKLQNSTKKFFASSKFFICDDVNGVEKTNLEKCIKRYGGILQNDLSDVQYAISNDGLSGDMSTFSGETVQPQWVLECSDMEIKVPTKKYIL